MADLNRRLYGVRLLELVGAETLDRLLQSGRLPEVLAARKVGGKPLQVYAGGWLARALALRPLPFVSYHDTWRYLELAFGWDAVGTLEEKPGIPPSPAHLARLQAVAKRKGVLVVAVAPYYPLAKARGLGEQLHVDAVVLPTQPGECGTRDVFALFDVLLSRLEQARGE